MTHYFCDECKRPAFFFRRRPVVGESLRHSEPYYTKGEHVFEPGSAAYCQECDTKFLFLSINKVMDNLDYLADKYERSIKRS